MTTAAAGTPPVITLINPSTGVRFDFRGTWLRNSPATDSDIKRGRAQFRGDKVWLNLPPGVQAQLDKGVLRYATEYDEQAACLGAAGSGLPDPGLPDLPGGAVMPDGRASHQAWMQYAIAQGVPQADAASLTRDQLRALFAEHGSGHGGTPDLDLLDEDPAARAARRR